MRWAKCARCSDDVARAKRAQAAAKQQERETPPQAALRRRKSARWKPREKATVPGADFLQTQLEADDLGERARGPRREKLPAKGPAKTQTRGDYSPRAMTLHTTGLPDHRRQAASSTTPSGPRSAKAALAAVLAIAKAEGARREGRGQSPARHQVFSRSQARERPYLVKGTGHGEGNDDDAGSRRPGQRRLRTLPKRHGQPAEVARPAQVVALSE